ncbi:type II toxin-antitoxin system RelE/ParE family toxin [Rhizobium sp. LjRoot258]|uniref:type II toxin-antitoxin system RelE/ParE family toxin n=1 Tax=Rhizobium sp. LjRoot258 TaxID=3342299 RepID=UPI003F4FCD08
MATLEEFPFSCRKATAKSALLRKLLIPFGSAGCVVLFQIEDSHTVIIATVRHQREEDYH